MKDQNEGTTEWRRFSIKTFIQIHSLDDVLNLKIL